MRLALYQPDIPPNTGTLMRTAACFGVAVDIIEPCGFPFSAKAFQRAGMDYLAHVDLTRHRDWMAFTTTLEGARLVLATTQGAIAYHEVAYRADDVLLLGQESAGVPPQVHARAGLRVRIPLAPRVRSLNVAIAGAIILAEALRQTGGFPAAAS
ncbi:MAG: tRNA (cytidine(34)-2'-O)-methyltransferase [Pseudomonadota bacterium]